MRPSIELEAKRPPTAGTDLDRRFTIRAARPDDAEAVARSWLDASRYYAALDPRRFRVPERAGLTEWTRNLLAAERGEDELWLVIEVEGRVVGDLKARIDRPAAGAAHELLSDLGESVLRVDSIAVAQGDRRQGAGTALMALAEGWARERGATRAFLTTAIGSAIAVPFYEERMGYERVSIGFWKLL